MPTSEPTRGTIVADTYELVERLDTCPLGTAWRATQTRSGKSVRLLFLSPQVAGRENAEEVLRRSPKVTHQRLLPVLEHGQHDGMTFVAFEDFQGITLRELLQQHRVQGVQLALREAAAIISQVLEGLRAANEAGVIVRALRPEYVLVNARRAGPRGANLVADTRVMYATLWDLVPVGVLAEDEFNRGETQYLAPELKSFNPAATPRCDVFSSAVIFYELLVGVAPTGTFQLPRQRRPDLPQLADDVCASALANAAQDRYATARDFLAAIQELARAKEDEAELPVRTTMHPMVWVLAFTLVIALAFLLYRSSGDPKDAAKARDNALRNEIAAAYTQRDPSEDAALLARHPPNMMVVPAGPYVSGRLHQEPKAGAEDLAKVVELPTFLIDVFEYPNLKDAPPRRKASFKDAQAACAEAGKRLCSAAELEKACKGRAGLIYGYSDEFSATTCGNGVEDIAAAGARPDCKSGWGVYDIAGNLREWSATEPSPGRALVKGGLPDSPARGTRCAFATDLSTAYTDETLSFRCCRDADAPPVATP